MRRRLLLILPLLTACEGELFTDDEWARLESLVNVDEDPLPDPVNKYIGDPEAIELGRKLFYDPRFSGVATAVDVLRRSTSASRAPVGQPMKIMCATCHDPLRGGVDHSSVPGHVSIGAGIYDVNAESVINAAYYDLKYWNGRYDSLVWQAMAVTESAVSMNNDRLRVAWTIHDVPAYAADFEAVFDEYELADFPRSFDAQSALIGADGQCLATTTSTCPEADCDDEGAAGCWPKYPLHGRPADKEPDPNCDRAGTQPNHDAFDCMDDEVRKRVNRTFVNYAKAIAAFEFTLISRNALFDRWVTEGPDSELLDTSARRGAKLFVSKASCIDCHRTPLFSDGKFHNVGVPQAGAGVPTEADCPKGAACDCSDMAMNCSPWGAYFGINGLHATPLRVDNTTYSDDPTLTDRLRSWYEDPLSDDLKGAWRTPSLRDVAITAPYMHDGYYRSLEEVVRHYAQGGTRLGSASDHVDKRVRPLDLTDDEIQDLVEFLKTLTGEALPMDDVKAPTLP